ncbi:MAG TPA: YdcF family protein [Pyrinomonadaceae bacterium]|jgi:uncharacterized SAM-binding protein YcdF (DUF218 family)
MAACWLVVRAPPERADALLVLSGAADYRERAEWAARLFREGRAPKIVLTNDGLRGGWSSAEQRNPFFYERAREELLRAGVPEESIEVWPEVVSSTFEEARQARRLAEQRGTRSLLVVTSPFHTRRALWTLRRVFRGSNIAVGIDAPPEQAGACAKWWLGASGWRSVGGEYAKLAYYRLRYAREVG